ncbi:MAG: MgtC/SapB family protein [Alphaproteobacteria bacterium]|nr:MgtC/SapB family protein [Alphaproteobacteria bacterium]
MPELLIPEESARVVLRVAFALAIGFLIGLERGWRQRAEASGDRLAGIRTYTLYGLLGGLAGVLPAGIAGWAIAAAILGAAALVVAGYSGALAQADPDRGLTSEAAALATVVLGALAGQGELLVAAAGAVMLVLVLSLKAELHGLLDVIRYEEIQAAIKLLVISVLVLPFLPDRGFGPGGVLNPYEIWWAVVLVASLSFVGYVAIRALGGRNGPLAFGFIGGLASSTAVTVTGARLARTDPALAGPFAGAIAAASATMMLRVAVLLLVFAPALFAIAWPPLAAGAVAALCAGFALRWFGPAAAHDDTTLPPPDDLWFALIFGGLLTAISLGIHYAEALFGDAGLYALAATSGTLDVDAFTLSAARTVGRIEAPVAARDAVMLAVAGNTVMKGVLSYSIGGEALFKRVAAVIAVSLAAGAAVWLVS